MRLLRYTLFRVVIVLAAAGLLYLVGLRSWLLWVAALVVGAMVSFLVLKDERLAAAQVLAEYDPLRRDRPSFSAAAEGDADYEDGLVDAAGAARAPGERPSDGAPAAAADDEPRAAGGDQPSASPRPSSSP